MDEFFFSKRALNKLKLFTSLKFFSIYFVLFQSKSRNKSKKVFILLFRVLLVRNIKITELIETFKILKQFRSREYR